MEDNLVISFPKYVKLTEQNTASIAVSRVRQRRSGARGSLLICMRAEVCLESITSYGTLVQMLCIEVSYLRAMGSIYLDSQPWPESPRAHLHFEPASR